MQNLSFTILRNQQRFKDLCDYREYISVDDVCFNVLFINKPSRHTFNVFGNPA